MNIRTLSFACKTIFILLLVKLALPAMANAITRVYVQNNTPFTLDAVAQQTGEPLPQNSWHQSTSVVKPGQRAEVLWFNRDHDISDGKRFRFSTFLTFEGHKVDLAQELLGKFTGSHMWQTVCVDGTCDQWYDNNDDHSMQLSTAGEPTQVLYRSYFTGTDDNIEYILTQRPVVKASSATGINILSYNVYLRSIMINGQSIRTGFLKKELNRPWDVIVLCEAFDDDLRDDLVKSLAPQFPYHSAVVGKEGVGEEDGGVIVISRWPIDYQQRSFGDICNGTDCMADKGVLYTRIKKQNRIYHLFATHTNADNSGDDIAARRSQLKLIKSWIDALQLNSQEPVLIAGDLNVDRGRTEQYNEMLQILDAANPPHPGIQYSFDPSINNLASGIRAEDIASMPYSEQFGMKPTPPQLLDYVLYSKKHLPPVMALNRTLLIRHASGWKELPTEPTMYDLSDHFAVLGEYEFGLQMKLAAPPPVLEAKIPKETTGTAQQNHPHDLALSPCVDYARTAVDQEQKNQQYSCNFAGPEWNKSYNWHFDWCTKGNNNQYAAEATQERSRKLEQCRNTLKMKDNSKQDVCQDYANTAILQLKEAQKRKLPGIVAPVWSADYSLHYNWCLNAPPAEIIRGRELREAVLNHP